VIETLYAQFCECNADDPATPEKGAF
jgi:hypothetical protein